jgi:hypothetical protein
VKLLKYGEMIKDKKCRIEIFNVNRDAMSCRSNGAMMTKTEYGLDIIPAGDTTKIYVGFGGRNAPKTLWLSEKVK